MTASLSMLFCLGAEIIDLGVLSPQRGFVLERNTGRADFSYFQADLVSFPSSNRVTLRLTNELFTLDQVAALPSGKTVLGLVSVYQDGQTSAATLYRFDIRRGAPPAPSMRPTALRSIVNDSRPFQQLKRPVNYPPLPFGTNQVESVPEIPRGKSETYGEHLDKMADFYARNPRKRNE